MWSWIVGKWGLEKSKPLLYIQQGASLEAFLIFFWKQNETFPQEKKNRAEHLISDRNMCCVTGQLHLILAEGSFSSLGSITCLQLSARILPFIPVLSSRRRLRKILTNTLIFRNCGELIQSNIYLQWWFRSTVFIFLLSN